MTKTEPSAVLKVNFLKKSDFELQKFLRNQNKLTNSQFSKKDSIKWSHQREFLKSSNNFIDLPR